MIKTTLYFNKGAVKNEEFTAVQLPYHPSPPDTYTGMYGNPYDTKSGFDLGKAKERCTAGVKEAEEKGYIVGARVVVLDDTSFDYDKEGIIEKVDDLTYQCYRNLNNYTFEDPKVLDVVFPPSKEKNYITRGRFAVSQVVLVDQQIIEERKTEGAC